MKLTEWFVQASMTPEDLEGPLDGSGGPGGPTGDTGEPDVAQQPVMARRKRVCPCCHGTGEHSSGFECYRCDAGGSLEGDDPGAGACDGAGGSMSSTAAGHIGEPSYEEDDGYTRRMWDNWHPKLPDTIHRALGVTIPADHPARDTSRPMHERAHALLGDLSTHLSRGGGLGMHWTSDPGHLKKHLADRLGPGETPVLLHARTPPREHIEDNGWVHEDRAIRDWDTDEREVPIKRNAPVHVTGITWGGEHHDFDEPVTKTATAAGSTVRQVPPEEYRKFQLHDYPTARTLPALVKHFKQNDAEYYAKVKADVQANGFTTPALAKFKDPRGNPLKKPVLWEGHHRAAVAHELGLHLPVGDYDNDADHAQAQAGNEKWFRTDPRAEHTAAALPRPELPPEQEDALDDPSHSAYRRKTLDLAKNPRPGLHIWRSEHRAEDPAEGARSTGVGMHWSVNPDSVVGGQAPEGHRTVVWHGELDNPDQAIPRSHPMWSGKHMSMDHEAEVRLKPGSKVKLHGAYTWDGEGAPHGTPAVRNPEATAKGWNYHPIGEHAEVSGPRGHIDYSGFDLSGDAHSGSAAPHWSHPQAHATTTHEMHAGNMYQEHHGGKDPFDDIDWDGPEDDYRSHSNGIMTNNVVHDGWSKPEDLSEEDSRDWLRWHPDRAGIEERHHGAAKTAAAVPTSDVTRAFYQAQNSVLPRNEGHRRYSSMKEAQGHADEIVAREGLPPVAVRAARGKAAANTSRYDTPNPYAKTEKGKLPQVSLSPSHMNESALIHELAHHKHVSGFLGGEELTPQRRAEFFAQDPGGHGTEFQDHFHQMLADHHTGGAELADRVRGAAVEHGARTASLQGAENEGGIGIECRFPDDEPIHSVAAAHTASAHAEDDDGNIHRGVTVVLPHDVHKFVHDEAQPVASRAHMLLAHVRKAKPEITSEEARGTTGGLGNFWSPNKDKAHEYGQQGGFRAYHDHASEHGCGDENGDGGCRTTNVVIHAGEPHEKHHWTEVNREGEKYDRQYSWRLPVKPDAPLHVKGISWREGFDHESPMTRDYTAEKKTPYTEHDFPTPVKKRAGWSDNAIPSGARGRDHQGHEVEMTPQDGWAHLDGSHGEDDGTTVSDHPVTPYARVHKWLPKGKYWGPNSDHNDQRLFDGDHLRPEVSHDVMARVGSSLSRYKGWPTWTKVYFAGSEAATWEPFNGDFDILIGIDWPVFRKDNPKVTGTDAVIAQEMTDDLWHHTNVKDFYFDLDDGHRVGPFDRTFFVNPVAWDIKAIHPYAAYDVSDDTWAVKPLRVPTDWSAASLPESYWTYAEAMAKAVRAIGTLPAEERHRMAANLWEEIHTHRSDAFADGGHGLYDLANVVEKYLDQHPGRLWDKLTQWKNQAPSGAQPWVPTTAKRGFMETITRKWAEVRHDPGSDNTGADLGGVMVALVPPRDICEALVQEGGEPVESMHVTLAYLGGADQYSKEQLKALPDLVKGWAHGRTPLKPTVGGVGTFTNPNKHVLWAAVDIPHGGVFRDDLVRHLEGHGYEVRHDHGWTPHCTLRYSATPIRFMPKVEPATWDEDEIWVCVGGRWESFPIGG